MNERSGQRFRLMKIKAITLVARSHDMSKCRTRNEWKLATQAQTHKASKDTQHNTNANH